MDEEARRHVTDMFDYHAIDGALDERGFAQLLTEGFAQSFVEVPGFPDDVVKGDLRCLCARRLIAGLNLSLFRRTFQFFDFGGQGMLTLGQFTQNLEQLLYGSWQQKLQFLFFVTDTNDDGLLNATEMEAFLQEFRVFYYSMASDVFRLRLSKNHNPEIGARLEIAEQQLTVPATMVSADCSSLLDELDFDRDGFVSQHEWMAAEMQLPMVYGVLLSWFVGVADKARAGQFYLKLSIEEPRMPDTVETEPVEAPPPSPPRRFTLQDLRDNATFLSAVASVETH